MDRRERGEAFRQLRVTAGVKQSEVAGATGVNPSRVSQWEAGDFSLTPDQLQRFAQLIEMPLQLLLRELGYDLGKPLSFDAWRRQRRDRLHSTLRHRAHSQAADDANRPDDQGGTELIRSYGAHSVPQADRPTG